MDGEAVWSKAAHAVRLFGSKFRIQDAVYDDLCLINVTLVDTSAILLGLGTVEVVYGSISIDAVHVSVFQFVYIAWHLKFVVLKQESLQ